VSRVGTRLPFSISESEDAAIVDRSLKAFWLRWLTRRAFHGAPWNATIPSEAVMLISNPVDVGAGVRQRRIDLSMSQTELAERIAATRQWMSRFEQGKADVTLPRALAILRQLDLTVDLQPSIASAPGRGKSRKS
jgi:DNA-binding XRE family transcriptional regulator